jgi:ATP-dependent DNA helicase RecG
MFGKRPERFLPGAYTQYVEFNGINAAADILKEYKFAGTGKDLSVSF